MRRTRSTLAQSATSLGSLKILAELNLREMSVPQYHREVEPAVSLSGIRHRFKKLERAGWLGHVSKQPGGSRRNGTERFYRATGPAVFDNRTWADLPPTLKRKGSGTTFDQLSEEVEKAISAGTFDARDDRHLTWSLLLLDQQGWEKVASAIDSVFAFILNERDRAEDRAGAGSGEGLSRMTVGLTLFESPKDTIKAH